MLRSLCCLSALLTLLNIPISVGAVDCDKATRHIDNQHRQALARYTPATDDYFRALYGIEDTVFPVIEACPQSSAIMATMAELQLSLGQAPIALLYAQKALEFDPDSWQAHYAAGSALNILQQHAEGLEHLERASNLNPENYSLLVNLCSSYGKNGMQDKAIVSCSVAIDKGPYEIRGTAYYLRARAYDARGETLLAEKDDRDAREFGYRK